jgi:phosphoribosylanthranilate isomerase
MISVKVCGMRDPLNIHGVAGAGADYLGFIFYPGSKRYAGESLEKLTFLEATAGKLKVGVFVNEQPERVLALAGHYRLDLLQLHGNEPETYCDTIRKAGFGVIKTFGVEEGFDFGRLIPYLPVCDYFLFDKKSDQHGGTGRKFRWDILKEYPHSIPFFLSGGIGPEDAGAIREINHPAFYAVDINSRFELAPGMKDVDQVKSFIREIKTFTP